VFEELVATFARRFGAHVSCSTCVKQQLNVGTGVGKMGSRNIGAEGVLWQKVLL